MAHVKDNEKGGVDEEDRNLLEVSASKENANGTNVPSSFRARGIKVALAFFLICIGWGAAWITLGSQKTTSEPQEPAPVSIDSTERHPDTMPTPIPDQTALATNTTLDTWIRKMKKTSNRPSGHWYKDPELCEKKRESHYSCTASGFTWETGYHYITKNDACELLKILEIRSIFFAGDSFVRHLFAAAKLILTGDYEQGGVVAYPPEHHCSGEAQFNEKSCRVHALYPGRVCHDTPSRNTVLLDVTKDDMVPVLHAGDAKYDLIVWGIGNHNIRGIGSHAPTADIANDPNPREGILNATIYADKIFSKVCERNTSWMESGVFRNRVFWFPPHQRTNKHFYPDEHPSLIERFFRESSKYLEDHCHLSTIDTFTMTNFFLTSNDTDLTRDSAALSFDGIHYQRIVNVNKVQEMFKAIIEHVIRN